mgnify:CR=1 FL=1
MTSLAGVLLITCSSRESSFERVLRDVICTVTICVRPHFFQWSERHRRPLSHLRIRNVEYLVLTNGIPRKYIHVLSVVFVGVAQLDIVLIRSITGVCGLYLDFHETTVYISN